MKDNWAGAHGSGISIHALREEGDLSFQGLSLGQHNFYPRPPRGGRHRKAAFHKVFPVISIHALREEGDRCDFQRRTRRIHFYPRPPRGRRQEVGRAMYNMLLFLSTPSARRATYSVREVQRNAKKFLSTPSARRATGQGHQLRGCHRISIHALREEGDGGRNGFRAFQSISIHALREEGDEITLLSQERVKYFYPRPPRGGRPGAYSALFRPQNISIHALREEGDSFQVSTVVDGVVFLSTPSARRATGRPPPVQECYRHFYPRPPRGGRPGIPQTPRLGPHFYPRPPRGGRQLLRLCGHLAGKYFYPRPPRGGRQTRIF